MTSVGDADDGEYVVDTMTKGHSNAGREYGTDRSDEQKSELIEYLRMR